MSTFEVCAIVPTYDNPRTVEPVVHQVLEHVGLVIVVDDGSHPPAVEVLDRLGSAPGVVLLRHEHNRGKGAAMKTGLREAAARGFSHALQVDADGQHDLGDIPRFLDQARAEPQALVLAAPRFDDTRPRIRGFGHWLTGFWTRLEVRGTDIEDPQCGFRVYPVQAAVGTRVRGDRMDFDPEIAVRMRWGGTPIINLPTKVRYLQAEEGGISHFRMGLDNVLISWMHTRLMTLSIMRSILGSIGRVLSWPFRRGR